MSRMISALGRSLALILLVALSACATEPPTPTPTPAAALPTSEPFNGGTLIMALSARDPNTVDPALVGDTTSAFVVRQLFTGLVRLDNDLAVQPDIAASWQISADGRTYTFSLNPNARFADGTPIRAADVAYSLERASDPALGEYLPASTYLTDIVGVREKLAGDAQQISGLQVIDEMTIAITIDASKQYFLSKLAHPTSFVVDRRQIEADPDGWTERPNGSGAFVIGRWDHDERIRLDRNPNFYRDLAKLSHVRFELGPNANNALIRYEEGELDLSGVPSYALDRVRDENNPLSKQLLSVPQLAIQYIGMNVELPPFDDPKVREAFTLLIDRAKLADLSLAGSAVPARGIIPPGMPGFNPDLPEVAADLERAKQLISESRYGGIENLPPIAAYGGGWSLTLREVAAEIGITIEVRDYEDFGEYLAALDAKEFQLYDSGWYADYPDPENFVDLLFRGGSAENHTRYANPEVDRLLDAAATASEPSERWSLYRQAEQQIIADAPVIPLYHDIEYMLVKPYVQGLTVTPMGILDLATVELVR